MSNRTAAAWLALALFVGALIAGFVPVHANGVSCGSAFAAEDIHAIAAQLGDDISDARSGFNTSTTDYKADCASRRSTQMAFVIPLLIVGALGGGFLLLTARTAAPRTSA